MSNPRALSFAKANTEQLRRAPESMCCTPFCGMQKGNIIQFSSYIARILTEDDVRDDIDELVDLALKQYDISDSPVEFASLNCIKLLLRLSQ
jgi:hypothetical protein